jgi:isoprenylcysteine carboxyl methyltransferase (ICMT) family protein YpbQ
LGFADAGTSLDDTHHRGAWRTPGPYRFLRHPNYAVVTGEIAAVPLALGLPIYALVFSLLNAAVLAIRISAENAALGALASERPR